VTCNVSPKAGNEENQKETGYHTGGLNRRYGNLLRVCRGGGMAAAPLRGYRHSALSASSHIRHRKSAARRRPAAARRIVRA